MSSYSDLSENIYINVPAQYGLEAEISNQCSWFAFCMCKRIQNNNWIVPPCVKELEVMYIGALEEATQLRKEKGQVTWGESIFSRVIHDNIPLVVSEPRVTILNENDPDRIVFDLGQDKAAEDIQKFKAKIPQKPVSYLMQQIRHIVSENGFMFINRFGQSFLIYPNISIDNTEQTYYVFDSHCKECGIFTLGNVIKYIRGPFNSYSVVTWLCGYKGDGPISKNVLDKYFYNPVNSNYTYKNNKLNDSMNNLRVQNEINNRNLD